MIIETSDNRLKGQFVPRKGTKEALVRKAGSLAEEQHHG